MGRAPRHAAGVVWRGHHQQERRRAERRVEGERKQVGEQQEDLVPTLAADLVQDSLEGTLRSVGGSPFLRGRVRRLRINRDLKLHVFVVANVISKLNTRSQFRVFSPSDNCTSTLICTSTLFSLLFSYLSHHIGPSFFPSLSSPTFFYILKL